LGILWALFLKGGETRDKKFLKFFGAHFGGAFKNKKGLHKNNNFQGGIKKGETMW